MSVSKVHAAARQPVKACSKASSGCLRTLRSVNRRFPFQLGNLGYAPSGFIIASSARHIPFPIIPTSSDSSYGPHDARITRRTSRPHVSNNSTYSCSSRLLPLPLSAPCSLAPNAELAFTITFYVYGHVPSFNLMGFKLFHSPSSLAFVWPPSSLYFERPYIQSLPRTIRTHILPTKCCPPPRAASVGRNQRAPANSELRKIVDKQTVVLMMRCLVESQVLLVFDAA